MDKLIGDIAFKGFTKNSGSDYNLVFIHGSGCNLKFLKPLAKRLPNYNSYLIDLPGHGKSNDTGYSFENYVDKVIEFVSKLDNVILIGHSLGGTIALGVAAKNIQSVKGAVIISSGASYPKLDKSFMDKVHKGKVDKLYLMKFCGSIFNPIVIKTLLNTDPKKVMIKDLLIDEKVNVENSLKYIKIPISIITGEDEILALVEYSKTIHKRVKGSKLTVIPRAKHMLPIIKRRKVASLINNLINICKGKK